MPLVSVDFLSVATVKRTIVVDVLLVGTPAEQLATARQKAGIEMAKDEDRNNLTGSWSVLRVVDPPIIDSAPRFTVSSIDAASAELMGRPKTLFG